MKNLNKYIYLVSLFLLPIFSLYSQSTNVDFLKGSETKSEGSFPSFMATDMEGNIYSIWKKFRGTAFRGKFYFEIFDNNLQYKNSYKIELAKGERIIDLKFFGGNILLFTTEGIKSVSESGVVKVKKNIPIDGFIELSADKSKLLVLTPEKNNKEELIASFWVYDSQLNLLWNKSSLKFPRITIARIYMTQPEHVFITNAGNVIVKYLENTCYLIDKDKGSSIPINFGIEGEIASQVMFAELPSGKIVATGGSGLLHSTFSDIFYGELDQKTGKLSGVITHPLPNDLLLFFGVTPKKMRESKGIGALYINTIKEDAEGNIYLDFESSSGGTGGYVMNTQGNNVYAGTKFMHYSVVLVKLTSSGNFLQKWILPNYFFSKTQPKGGRHIFKIYNDTPYIITNNKQANLTGTLTKESKAKRVTGSSISTATYALELLNDGSFKTKELFSVKKNKLYLCPELHTETEDGIFFMSSGGKIICPNRIVFKK